MKNLFLILYYMFFSRLPNNYFPIVGSICRKLRLWCCRSFCKGISKTANINKNVYLGSGGLVIGEHSGLGLNCRIEACKVQIGNDVIIGADVFMGGLIHITDKRDETIRTQGALEKSSLIIEDDCWISARTIITPSCKRIGKGSIIKHGSVLMTDIPEYSIVAGNPAQIIGTR